MEEKQLFTAVEDEHFNQLLSSVRSFTSTTLNAYTCDLTSTTIAPAHPLSSSTTSTTDTLSSSDDTNQQQPTAQQQHRKHGRNTSMIQVQGISAYAPPGRKARHHERFHSTGINVRVPFERVEKPPPLRHDQTLRRQKYDAEYVHNSLEETKKARITAEQEETEQKRISANKLEQIQQEGALLKKQGERDSVRQRVLTLTERKRAERNMKNAEKAEKAEKAMVDDDGLESTAGGRVVEYDTRQDELYESWNRRNSAVMKKRSQKYPIKNDERNEVLDTFYKQVRRSSISQGTNVANAMRDRLDAYSLLGVVKKPIKKEEKEATVSDVFRR